MDNLEADMGALIFTGSGQPIYAAHKHQGHHWSATGPPNHHRGIVKTCQKSRRSLIDPFTFQWGGTGAGSCWIQDPD